MIMPAQGLSSSDAKELLIRFGPNQVYTPEKVSFLGIARHEITEPMILLLFFVGIVYSLWGRLDDAITIFAVITLLVLAEVNNEYRAKRAIIALGKIAAPLTRVIRDGKITEVDSLEVVPGDLIILTPGTKIAADAKISHSVGLQVDESALTGESVPVDRGNGEEVYAGTVVVSGEGAALVYATGPGTKFGQIASKTKEVKPPRTKLQLEMRALAGKLVYVALFFSILIPFIGILQGRELKTMVLTGLSLAFATIPEELPIIITMVLGLGAYTLSRHNFLVKKLNSAEALGTATVIVTDKTGTTTEGKMRIASIYPNARRREVLEAAQGAVSEYETSYMDIEIKREALALRIDMGRFEILGQRGFGEGRKTKTVVRNVNGKPTLFMSGAPEEVFRHCKKANKDVKAELDRQTSKGRRVIALAYGRGTGMSGTRNVAIEKLEKNLTLAGLIVFEDPIRPGVRDTIKDLARAGIRTIIVTGDHPATARFVASKIGILGRTVLTGEDLDSMSDASLAKAVKTVSVFARTTPSHKYRIMRALQGNGEVVAVTGDGINDVLALRGADIGIAMGVKGTDVAKEAAGVVLADDNYLTVAQGVFEGRTFFDNLQKGIEYYLSVKVALVLIFLLPVLLFVALPFAPIQIIVLELFMDLAASAGFVAEPREKDIYSRPPRDPKAPMLDGRLLANVFMKGIVLFAAVTAVYFYSLSFGAPALESQTLAFATWMFGYMALAFVSRSDREPVARLGVFTNRVMDVWAVVSVGFLLALIYVPALSSSFNLTAVSPIQLVMAAAVALVAVGALEAKKYVWK
ncbi:Copper-exporting P-type ATPase B [uncultured archaeon]|nr:Copper-exporting P-type ATPase B [uncultured archaeon]